MKTFKVLIVFLVLLSISIAHSQEYEYTEKWNDILKRVEYFDSNGNMIRYKQWNAPLQRYEVHKTDYQKTQNFLNNYPRKVRTYGKPIEPIDFNFLMKALEIKQRNYDSNNRQRMELANYNKQRIERCINSINTHAQETKNGMNEIKNEINPSVQHLEYIVKSSFDHYEKLLKQMKGFDLTSNELTNTYVEILSDYDKMLLACLSEIEKLRNKKKETLNKIKNFNNNWYSYRTYPKTIPNGWHRVAVIGNNFFADRDRKVYVENNKITKYVIYNWIYKKVTETESIVNGRASIKLNYGDYSTQIYFIDSVTDPESTASAPKPESYSGRVIFYTDDPECGIRINVEGVFAGTLNKYFPNGKPNCQQNDGVVGYQNISGTYSYKAESKSKTWKGTITIVGGECRLMKLNK